MDLLEKLRGFIDRYEALERDLSAGDAASDPRRFRDLSVEYNGLKPLAEKYRAYARLREELDGARQLAEAGRDPELKALAEAEAAGLAGREPALLDELKKLMVPRDPSDEKNVFIEIRPGAGGDEAALFAADLLRMYIRFAERMGWQAVLGEDAATELGGTKEAVLEIRGRGAYSKLKYESGVHRVQRVPATETQGRIHTSTATVLVLPEVDELDIQLKPDEVKVETMRSGGAGGQHVNKTESAVRLTHIPTGIVVHIQDEKSQHKNRAKAWKVLMARLYDHARAERDAAAMKDRKAKIGTGDRSEKIRTYNFPQSRITDHRIGFTTHQLQPVLDGRVELLADPLSEADTAEKLAAAG